MKPAIVPTLRDRIRAQLADLKMPGSLEALDDILRQTDGGALAAGPAIGQVLGAHIALRNARRLETARRASRLPAIKTLADFDFSFQPSVRHEQIESLHTLGFIERKENVVFLGPPGVGKTHLALSLAVAAVTGGRRVYYATLAELVVSLEEAQAQGGSPIVCGRWSSRASFWWTRSAICRSVAPGPCLLPAYVAPL